MALNVVQLKSRELEFGDVLGEMAIGILHLLQPLK